MRVCPPSPALDLDRLVRITPASVSTSGLGMLGCCPGSSGGDFGRWSLEGTAGPQFDGFNGSPGVGLTITFDEAVTSFSLDAARANGSSPAPLFILTGYLNGNGAGQVGGTLGAINQWSTFTLPGPVNRISFSCGIPFGVDNIQFTTSIPEPSLWSLLGFAVLSGIVFLRNGQNGRLTSRGTE